MWGRKAIEFAEAHRATVCRFPGEDRPRGEGISPDQARAAIDAGAWPQEFYMDVEEYEAS